MSFAVQTPVFEGPLDLLLHLILRDQVDLYEVSLVRRSSTPTWPSSSAWITCDLEIATEFLLIAATLVELKARRLLPERRRPRPRRRARPCGRSATCCSPACSSARRSRTRRRCSPSWPRSPVARSPARPGMEDAVPRAHARPPGRRHARRSCAPRSSRPSTPKPVPQVDLYHVAPIRASVHDAVAELIDELPRVGRISFRRLTESLVERLEIVVRFLAVLELFKQGMVDLDQADAFGDIEIRWTGGVADAD